jgi:hypothetical protein
MPEVIAFAIFVSKDSDPFPGKVSSHAIAVETLLKNHEAKLNVGHVPLVLAVRHFHPLRLN